MIRVGQVGIGQWGQKHCNILSQMKGIELVGVHDTDYNRLIGAHKLFKTQDYHNIFALVMDVDAIIITTPTSTHYEIAKEALEGGVHVFIEKPVCAEVWQAEELAKLANGSIIQVGHIERFNPAYQRLKKEKFKPKIVHCSRFSNEPSRCNDVSVVMDLMIHDIDLVFDLMRGDIVYSIDAFNTPDNMLIVTLKFVDSGVITFQSSRLLKCTIRTMHVWRQDGDYYSLDFRERTLHKNDKLLQKETNENLLELELKAFIESVRENKPPLVGIDDAIKSLKVAKEIESMINGKDLSEVSKN